VELWLAVGGIQGVRRGLRQSYGHARGSKLSAGAVGTSWNIPGYPSASSQLEATGRPGHAADSIGCPVGAVGMLALILSLSFVALWPSRVCLSVRFFPTCSMRARVHGNGRLSAERSGAGACPVRPSSLQSCWLRSGRGTSNNSGYSARASRCRSPWAMTSEAQKTGETGGRSEPLSWVDENPCTNQAKQKPGPQWPPWRHERSQKSNQNQTKNQPSAALSLLSRPCPPAASNLQAHP